MRRTRASCAASTATSSSLDPDPTPCLACLAHLVEFIQGGGFGPDSDVALMLDQCHNIEKKIPGQIRSVLNVQEMTARALLLNTEALEAARK